MNDNSGQVLSEPIRSIWISYYLNEPHVFGLLWEEQSIQMWVF